jgi:peroxiredoxin
VAAVVADRRDKIRRYIEETGLPFDVLIDERQDTIRAYGVWHRFGFIVRSVARPAAFLIDPDSSIRGSWIGENQTQFPTTDDILAAAATRG